MVYDIPSYDYPFEDRMEALQAVVETSLDPVHQDPALLANQL